MGVGRFEKGVQLGGKKCAGRGVAVSQSNGRKRGTRANLTGTVMAKTKRVGGAGVGKKRRGPVSEAVKVPPKQ